MHGIGQPVGDAHALALHAHLQVGAPLIPVAIHHPARGQGGELFVVSGGEDGGQSGPYDGRHCVGIHAPGQIHLVQVGIEVEVEQAGDGALRAGEPEGIQFEDLVMVVQGGHDGGEGDPAVGAGAGVQLAFEVESGIVRVAALEPALEGGRFGGKV